MILSSNTFNIERLGEILNLSMSSASSAVSVVLEKEVKASTMEVKIDPLNNINFSAYEPSVWAEYDFKKGAQGKGVIILKKQDVKKIVGAVLQSNFTDEEFEIDEISISALNEVLSPLVQTCYDSVSNFSNNKFKVSQTKPFDVSDNSTSIKTYFADGQDVVSVKLKLVIGGVVDSEMMLLYNEEQAKQIVGDYGVETQEPNQTHVQQVQSQPVSQPMQQPVQNMNTVPAGSYDVRPPELTNFADQNASAQNDRSTNLDMIMNVPLKVSVEIGNTNKKIKDIVELTSGAIIELDKQAGDPVDVFVNGKLIANGEVVVVDECYGVRIKDILDNGEIIKIL